MFRGPCPPLHGSCVKLGLPIFETSYGLHEGRLHGGFSAQQAGCESGTRPPRRRRRRRGAPDDASPAGLPHPPLAAASGRAGGRAGLRARQRHGGRTAGPLTDDPALPNRGRHNGEPQPPPNPPRPPSPLRTGPHTQLPRPAFTTGSGRRPEARPRPARNTAGRLGRPPAACSTDPGPSPAPPAPTAPAPPSSGPAGGTRRSLRPAALGWPAPAPRQRCPS